MIPRPPVPLAALAGAGFRLVATTLAGLLGGLAVFHYLRLAWAVPSGILLGFIGGVVAMYRDLSRLAR